MKECLDNWGIPSIGPLEVRNLEILSSTINKVQNIVFIGLHYGCSGILKSINEKRTDPFLMAVKIHRRQGISTGIMVIEVDASSVDSDECPTV